MIFIILNEKESKYTIDMLEEKNKRIEIIDNNIFEMNKEKNILLRDIRILKQQLEDDYRESYRED